MSRTGDGSDQCRYRAAAAAQHWSAGRASAVQQGGNDACSTAFPLRRGGRRGRCTPRGWSLAHECVNASKQNQAAGVQVVIDANTGEVVWTTNGVANRIAQGLIDPVTGDGFQGLLGFDLDGDSVVDVSTWIVGPNGELPLSAQYNGPSCKGVTNIATWFAECMG